MDLNGRPDKIVLIGQNGRYEEGVAGAAGILPGTIVAFGTDGKTITAPASGSDVVEVIVLTEAVLNGGKDKNSPTVLGEQQPVWIAGRGDVIQVRSEAVVASPTKGMVAGFGVNGQVTFTAVGGGSGFGVLKDWAGADKATPDPIAAGDLVTVRVA